MEVLSGHVLWPSSPQSPRRGCCIPGNPGGWCVWMETQCPWELHLNSRKGVPECRRCLSPHTFNFLHPSTSPQISTETDLQQLTKLPMQPCFYFFCSARPHVPKSCPLLCTWAAPILLLPSMHRSDRLQPCIFPVL